MKLNHTRLATLITALVGAITMGACTMASSEAPAPAAEGLGVADQALSIVDQSVTQYSKGKPFTPVDPCAGRDGNYCASAVGFVGSNVLFHCSQGTLFTSEQCDNGCIEAGNQSMCFVPGVLPSSGAPSSLGR